jgi:hypothetical protein
MAIIAAPIMPAIRPSKRTAGSKLIPPYLPDEQFSFLCQASIPLETLSKPKGNIPLVLRVYLSGNP